MSDRPPISVFLITKNEARFIGEVLTQALKFDEVVLVDSGSTDGTVDIARSMGVKVLHQDWLGFAKQKAFAMAQCTHEWVLNLDGDEILPDALINQIKQAVADDSADALRLRFEDVFWGRPMSPHSAKRSIVRVYKKDKVRFPTDRKVHENVVLSPGAREKTMSGLVTHFGYGSTELLMNKQNTYSSLKAMEKFEKGKSPSVLKLVFVFPVMFIRAFLFRKMFLSGKRGLVHATIEAMYAFLKEAKLYEAQTDKSDKPPID